MKLTEIPTIRYPKVLLVGIHSLYNTTKNIQSYYDEFINLAKSNNIRNYETIFIKLRSIDAAYYVTKGKLEEIEKICREQQIEEVVFSEPLNPQQERNLSKLLNCPVFDRTQLILEIFEKGAHSAEGKLQVELAMMQHQKSRLAGRGIEMSQQAGRIGNRGPGETAKEREMQHIEHRIVTVLKEIKQLEQHRKTQRKARLENNIPLICLVGYTNAGKSTILNTLTHSNVLAENKLFATLDTTTRELYIDSKKKGLISDTVGFIQQLPHKLIEAFKSTLTELQYAHLLLNIVDISDPNWESHITVVEQVLEEIEVTKPILHVFNKADLITEENKELIENHARKYQPHIFVSAKSKETLEPLIDFLRNWYPEKT